MTNTKAILKQTDELLLELNDAGSEGLIGRHVVTRPNTASASGSPQSYVGGHQRFALFEDLVANGYATTFLYTRAMVDGTLDEKQMFRITDKGSLRALHLNAA